jgi:hypothetical protein
VDNTLRSMESSDIEAFLVKIIENFESSTMFKKNLVMWLDSLLKLHFLNILSLPAKTLDKLKNLQTLIKNRTKSLNKVIEVKSKLENLMTLFGANKSIKTSAQTQSNEFKTYTPMAIYNESDSEDDFKQSIYNKLKKKSQTK